MRSKITIDGKEVELLSNAATPYRFKQVFGKDLIRIFTNAATNKLLDDADTVTMAQQMAYIMAKQAEGGDLSALSEDDFLLWMENFDPLPFNSFEVAASIIAVYSGQQKTTSQPKKKADQPKEK